ncbi:hypothetical protein MUP95_09940 [bacterium]|nr:hypothetical protein [bacterium]
MKTYTLLIVILLIVAFNTINCERIFNSFLSPINENKTNSNHILTLNDTLSIACRGTLFNHEENIWLSFDSLITDSRCPIGVQCVWEGNAKVSLIFNSIQFNLNTHASFARDTTISTYHIDLIYVWPYPHIDSLYTKNQYSVEIMVTK